MHVIPQGGPPPRLPLNTPLVTPQSQNDTTITKCP